MSGIWKNFQPCYWGYIIKKKMSMNLKAINKSNELFEGLMDKEYLINPISKVDSNIIRELRELLKKLGCSGVTAILDDFKYLKDQEIEEALLDYNTNFKEKEDRGGDRNEDIQEKDVKSVNTPIESSELSENFASLISKNKSDISMVSTFSFHKILACLAHIVIFYV